MATNAQYLASLVNSSGNINNPVSNAGINFNNSSATGASTLTDYETGTWIPKNSGGTALSLQAGSSAYYIKVGKLVFVTADISSLSEGNIYNLPFASQASPASNPGGCFIGYNTWSSQVVSGVVSTNTSRIDLYQGQTGATPTANRFAISAVYQAQF